MIEGVKERRKDRTMHKTNRRVVLLAILAGLSGLAGCKNDPPSGATAGSTPKPASTPPPSAEPTDVSLLIFPEYIDEKSIKDFEKANNARLRITLYDSTEEMESKLAYAGADSQYDVVVMASQVLGRMQRRGLIRPLDHAQIPNLKNLEERFSGANFDDGNKYAVPYQWGTVGIMYNKKKFPNIEPTWGLVLDPKKVAGTFALIDEMRDMLGVVLKYKGYSSNTAKPEEVREAGKIIADIKKHPKCVGFKAGIGATQEVKGGSVDMAVVWNGNAYQSVRQDREGLGLVIPKEGSIIWTDTMTISAKAPHPELAHKFINHMLSPEAGSQLSAMTKYATPNKAAQAMLPAEDRTDAIIYPSADTMKTLENHRDVGEAVKVYDEVWTDVKSR